MSSSAAETEIEVPVEDRREEREEPPVEESSGEEESDGSGKNKKRKGGTSKKGGKSKKGKKRAVTDDEEPEPDSAAPTPPPKRGGPIPWRSGETLLEALASGEATMVAKPGSKGGVWVRFGGNQDMMKGYTLNLLAFIVKPEMVYTESSFQTQLAKLVLSVGATQGFDKMMGREDDAITTEIAIPRSKFDTVTNIVVAMLGGIKCAGKPEDIEFADVAEQVLRSMHNIDQLNLDVSKRNSGANRNYNLAMGCDAALAKADKASTKTELDKVLSPLKHVAKAFPEIAAKIKITADMFENKERLLAMAGDASITEVEMAARLSIPNPDKKKRIIHEFLQKSPTLQKRFDEARLNALIDAQTAGPVVQRVAATSLVAPPTISPYPTIEELAHAVYGPLLIKGEGETLAPDDIRVVLELETRREALGFALRRFCAAHVKKSKAAKMLDYGTVTTVDEAGVKTVTPRTEEQAIATLGMKEGQYDKVVKLVLDTIMEKVTAIVMRDVQYQPPKETGMIQLLPAHKFSVIITGIVCGSFATARTNLEIVQDADLVGHRAVVPGDFTEQVWGADLLDVLNALLLEIRVNGNYNKRSLTLLKLFPVTPADDGAIMHVMKLIQAQMPGDIPVGIRAPIADSILFVLLCCSRTGLYHIDTFVKDMGFPPGHPCFIEPMQNTLTMGGMITDDFVYVPPPREPAAPTALSTLADAAAVAAALEIPAAAGATGLDPPPPAPADPETGSSSSLSPESPAEFICRMAKTEYLPEDPKLCPPADKIKAVLNEATYGLVDVFIPTAEQSANVYTLLGSMFDKLVDDGHTINMLGFTEAVHIANTNEIDINYPDIFLRGVVAKACKNSNKTIPETCSAQRFHNEIRTKVAAKIAAELPRSRTAPARQ